MLEVPNVLFLPFVQWLPVVPLHHLKVACGAVASLNVIACVAYAMFCTKLGCTTHL